MVHSGYEATAVNDIFSNPGKAMKVAIFGPRIDGPMAPELPVTYQDEPQPRPRLVAEIKPASSGGCKSNKHVA
jgi:hypothetical protein